LSPSLFVSIPPTRQGDFNRNIMMDLCHFLTRGIGNDSGTSSPLPRKKGIWMAAVPVRVPGQGRKLIVTRPTPTVRSIFKRFFGPEAATLLTQDSGRIRSAIATAGNRQGVLYKLRKTGPTSATPSTRASPYTGEHDAILTELWGRASMLSSMKPPQTRGQQPGSRPRLLKCSTSSTGPASDVADPHTVGRVGCNRYTSSSWLIKGRTRRRHFGCCVPASRSNRS